MREDIYNNNFNKELMSKMQGGAKVGLQLWGHETQSLILYYYLLIIVFFIQTTVNFLLPYPVYKELIQLNNQKKETILLKNGQRTWTDTFPQIIQMNNRYIWRCSLAIRQMQVKA